ncbi:MAG: hypothetical protein ABI432_00405 [Flavobacteriales bacterium]
MHFRRIRSHLFVGLLAFAGAWFWNSWNIQVLRREMPDLLREGVTVATTDDASYLRAVEDLVNPPATDHVEKPRVDLRAPGYRLWYLLPRLFLPPPGALRALVVVQCLLFACSVMLLWEVLLVFGIAPIVRWTCTLLIALMPTFHGFLFYTLTESVTPALVLGTVCCALLGKRPQGNGWLVAAVVLWSLLMVTRPVLTWAGLPLLQALWSRYTDRAALLRIVGMCVLAFVPTGIWWAYNMTIAGGYVGLHPIYRADEPGINRPTHEAFWELAKSWGIAGDTFHSVMEPAFQNALTGDTSRAYAEQFVDTAPSGELTPTQRAAIIAEFNAWQHFTSAILAPALARPERALGPQPEEQVIIDRVAAITGAYRSDHAWHYHVIVPLSVLRKLVAHSNLNLFLFQHTLRGRPWMEALRWCSAMVHVLLLLSVSLALFWRIDPTVRSAALGAAAYLLYLAYVQRGVEERYTLPVLHMSLLCAAFVCDAGARWWVAWRASPPTNS